MTPQATDRPDGAAKGMKAPHKAWLIWAGAFLAGFIVLFACALLLVQTTWVQQKIQHKINALLPGAVTWEQGRISLLKSSLVLKQGRLLDPEQQTVATFDQLAVRFNLSALLRKTVDITDLVLNKPHLDLTITAEGVNLKRVFTATAPKTAVQGDNDAPPFNWVVRSLQLHNGQLNLNDSTSQLTVKAASIEFAGQGNFSEQKGRAQVSLGAVEIQSPRFNQRFTSSTLSAQMQKDRLVLLSNMIHTDRSRIAVTGGIEHLFTEPHVDLTAEAELDLAELKTYVPVDAGLNGRLTVKMQAQGSWNDPRVTLRLTSEDTALFAHDIETILIDLAVANRVVALKEARVSMPGGATASLSGNIDISPLFPRGITGFKGNLNDVSYSLSLQGDQFNLAPLFPADSHFAGIANGRLKINGRGLDPRHATVDVALDINTPQLKARWLERPLDLRASFAGNLENGTAVWSALDAHSEAFHLTSQGQLHLDSRQIDSTLALNVPEISHALAPWGVNGYGGSLVLDATLSGFVQEPVVALKATGKGLEKGSYRLGDLFITGRYTDKSFAVTELRLDNQTSAISLEGAIGFKDPQTGAWTPNPALALTIRKASLGLQDFSDTMKGRLNLAGAIKGTVQRPTGQVHINGREIDLGGQPIESISGTVFLENGRATVDMLKVNPPRSAPVTLKGWYQWDGTYQANVAAEGVDLGAIAVFKNLPEFKGLLDLQLSGQGTVADPQFDGTIRFRQLQINGNPSQEVNLALSVRDGAVRIDGDLGFALAGTYAPAPGEFSLSAHFNNTDLAPYFTLLNRDRFGGLLTGRISAQGNVARMSEMTAQAGLSDVRLTYDGQAVVKAGRINLAMAKGKATISQAELELMNNGNLQVEGLMDPGGKLDLRIQGALPVQALQVLRPEASGLSGNIELNARITGTPKDPVYKADIALSDVGGTLPYLKQKLSKANGRISIDAAGLVLEDIEGHLDDGTFALSGAVQWHRFEPRQIDLKITARRLPIDIPETLQARVDGNLQFSGDPLKSMLSGRLVLHDGLYYEDIDLQKMLTSQASPAKTAPPSEKGPNILGWEAVGLDVMLKRGGIFQVENNLSELDIDFDLHFKGVLNRPVVNGRAKVLSGEIYFPVLSLGTLVQTSWIPASTQTFVVQRGVIDFINPTRIEPYLDIRGQVGIRHWTVYLDISGTPETLEYTLSSNPSESEADIVSLLLTGRTAREIAGEGEAAGLSNEQRMVKFMASTFQDDLKALTGLDIIETGSSPADSSNSEASVTVTVGKKLSERLTLKYATESRGADIINSVITEYRILENIRARGFQNTTGNFGGSISYRHEFR